MKKSMIRWFYPWKIDKEKEFLEKQSLDGYRLVKVAFGRYIFEKDIPQKLIYQMDFRGLGGKISEAEYMQIYEDAGWKLISKANGWYYFCQEYAEKLDLTIFNDNDSKSRVYLRLISFLLLTGFPLYFSMIFILPRIDHLNYYFLILVIMSVITVLHLVAILRLLNMYKKVRSHIHE
ncbi:MAG: DUF2812 domain-containing protein [Firmicutes bacterium]|nr:DUF2812 domain-containing protein [Bacillota bacterium]